MLHLVRALVALLLLGAFSSLQFDQDVTPDVLFGSGNANGSFTLARADGVELGLRGKLRFPASNLFMSNGDGSYTFSTGSGTSTPPDPEWGFEWSVNSDWDGSSGLVVSDLSYEIGMDFDPGAGTDFLAFDMITLGEVLPYTPAPPATTYWDHSIGTNATGNGGGSEAPFGDGAAYQALIDTNNVAQNSWRLTFFDEAPFDGFDPSVPGRYDFYLAAFDGAGSEVARTSIAVFAMDGPTLSLEGDVCQRDQDPITPGVQIAVELWLRNPDDEEITGFQAFLAFDELEMTYVGATSGYDPSSSFVNHIQAAATAEVAPGELRLDGNTDFLAMAGATGDERLATLLFTVDDCSSNALGFDLTQPFPSELSFAGSALTTSLLDGPAVFADDAAPMLVGVPADITQPADAGSCAGAVVSFAMPAATDNCDPSPTVEVSPPSGSSFPVGTTTVTVTATDACGNQTVDSFDVTVTPTNLIDVVVELPGSAATTRCIEFLTDCGPATSTSLVFAAGTPATAVATIEVPCGTFTSLCAKDEQHTLWDSTSLTVVGNKYVADFALSLAGGDTDDDGDVDINDVTFFLAQFGQLDALSTCPWDGTRDADFSNNGAVGAEDYVFLTANWLASSGCTCAAPVVGGHGRGPQVRARVSDILSRAADFDRDGWVDVRDVELFEERFGLSGALSQRMRASAR